MITRAEFEAAKQRAIEILAQADVTVRPDEVDHMEVANFGLGELEQSGAQIVTLMAAERLAQDEGVNARVLYCHTIKPLDVAAVLQAADDTGAVVVAENNVRYGGLGSAVAELLVANNPIPMRQIGVNDTFAESGPYLEVIDKYGLTSPHIINAAREVLAHKARFFSPAVMEMPKTVLA